jgi:hypothetical protein
MCSKKPVTNGDAAPKTNMMVSGSSKAIIPNLGSESYLQVGVSSGERVYISGTGGSIQTSSIPYLWIWDESPNGIMLTDMIPYTR